MSHPLSPAKLFCLVLLPLVMALSTASLAWMGRPPVAAQPQAAVAPVAPVARQMSLGLAARIASQPNGRPEPQPVPVAPSTALSPLAQAAGGSASPFSQPETGGVLALLTLACAAALVAVRVAGRARPSLAVALCQ